MSIYSLHVIYRLKNTCWYAPLLNRKGGRKVESIGKKRSNQDRLKSKLKLWSLGFQKRSAQNYSNLCFHIHESEEPSHQCGSGQEGLKPCEFMVMWRNWTIASFCEPLKMLISVYSSHTLKRHCIK